MLASPQNCKCHIYHLLCPGMPDSQTPTKQMPHSFLPWEVQCRSGFWASQWSGPIPRSTWFCNSFSCHFSHSDFSLTLFSYSFPLPSQDSKLPFQISRQVSWVALPSRPLEQSITSRPPQPSNWSKYPVSGSPSSLLNYSASVAGFTTFTATTRVHPTKNHWYQI